MCRIPSARNPSNSTYAYGRYIRFRLLSQQRRHHLRCRQCKGILDNLRNSFNIMCRRSIIAILYLPITSMNIGFRLLSLPPEARQRFCKLDKMHFRFLLFCWISASSLFISSSLIFVCRKFHDVDVILAVWSDQHIDLIISCHSFQIWLLNGTSGRDMVRAHCKTGNSLQDTMCFGVLCRFCRCPATKNVSWTCTIFASSIFTHMRNLMSVPRNKISKCGTGRWKISASLASWYVLPKMHMIQTTNIH